MMDEIDQVRADFQDAQTGSGTRYLTVAEARRLLEYCAANGWAFQSVETSEVIATLEYPRIDRSLLGLTGREKAAVTATDLVQVARDLLNAADAGEGRFIFKVWINSVEDILAKTLAARE